jgi:hypothetical protein
MAHLWHIRNLNPPVAVRAGTAPLTSAQVSAQAPARDPSGRGPVPHLWHTSQSHRQHTPTVIQANSDELKPRHKGSLARPERRSQGNERTNTNSAIYPFREMTRCTGRKRSPLAFGYADVSVVVRRLSTTTLGLTELRHRQAEGSVFSCQHPGNPR